MKSRIPKIALSLALAVPASIGAVQIVKAGCFDNVMDAILFYGNLPARLSDAAMHIERLSERMNPICSECNEPSTLQEPL
jgi:hypothetical protein